MGWEKTTSNEVDKPWTGKREMARLFRSASDGTEKESDDQAQTASRAVLVWEQSGRSACGLHIGPTSAVASMQPDPCPTHALSLFCDDSR